MSLVLNEARSARRYERYKKCLLNSSYLSPAIYNLSNWYGVTEPCPMSEHLPGSYKVPQSFGDFEEESFDLALGGNRTRSVVMQSPSGLCFSWLS